MVIKFEEVNFSYDKANNANQLALKDINFTINKGDVVAVVGETGSGKSTLIQHFNGLLKPASGQVFFNFENVSFTLNNETKEKDLKELRSKVGMVFQFPENQLFAETVLKDVMYAPINFGYSEEEAEQMAKEALSKLNFPKDLWQVNPFELSGGQMRRVAMAGILAYHPEIIILDEPSAGLDPVGQQQLLDLILELKNSGVTVIFISHKMEHVLAVADKVLVLAKGQLIADEATDKLFERPRQWFLENGLDLTKASIFADELRNGGYFFNKTPLTTKQLADEINSQI